MDKDLYSRDLSARLEAVRRLNGFQKSEKTPGFRGALNAWALFLGSNPGGGPVGDENTWVSRIGPDLIGKPFINDGRRNASWCRLFRSVLGEDAADALWAMGNLYFQPTKKESEVSVGQMDSGCARAWEIGQLYRPRFVITLTKRVHQVFSDYLCNKKKIGQRFEKSEYFDDEEQRSVKFTWDGADFTSFLLKSPRHPSRPIKTEFLQQFSKKIKELDSM